MIEAQHLPKGDHRRYLLLKNLLSVECLRAGRMWVIDDMTFRNVWYTDDPTVLFPPPR